MSNKSYKILSFNACILPPMMTNAGARDDQKQTRIKLFFEDISSSYDILLFQEVWEGMWSTKSNSAIQSVIKYGKQYNFNYSHHLPRSFLQICSSGLLILSKFPITSASAHTFQSSTGVQCFVPNGVLHSTISLPSSSGDSIPIDFFVTHIHAGPLDSAFLNDTKTSRREINCCLKTYKNHFYDFQSRLVSI